ncbi:hypothetical protein AAG596_15715 [Citromicrobium bathyomarinum]|uniref:hypothetical protein n=1 Tax=Citromicrobium bathyomarinum TaxID=72174 RepID=UPI00315B29A4
MPEAGKVQASDMLAGDQYARKDWQARIEGGDETLTRLARAHGQYRSLYQNVRDAYAQKDPEMTGEAHFMATRKLGQKSLDRAATASDQAREFAEAEVKAIKHTLTANLGLVENHRAGEIRTALRSLSEQERASVLKAAVESKDAQTIAAVIEGPAWLSGVTQEQAKAFGEHFKNKHGGDLPARLKVLEDAIAINRRTATDALTYVEALLPSQRARDIEAKQAAARKMREQLSEAV